MAEQKTLYSSNKYVSPNETRLALGMDMLLSIQGFQGDYKTKLIGAQPFDCIITSLPRIPGFVKMATPHAEMLVRYIAEGTVYGFTTRILGHVMKPVPMLFAAYPQRLERYELRKSSRLNCFMPALLHTTTRSYKTYVLDLSEGGCRTNTPLDTHCPSPEVGDIVLLELPLCGGDTVVITRAEVRNIQRLVNIVSYGLSFLAIEPDTNQRLLAFLEQGHRFT